jgi:uncharacterized protein (DUF934 family)
MPMLIKWTGQNAELVEDPFTKVGDEDPVPQGDVIVSLQRFQAEGQRLLDEGRRVGVRIEPNEDVEDLVPDLARIAVVAVAFPKFLHGQGYSSAAILRERGYLGEIRAVGDVLREQARFMVRVGVDTFEPADGSSAADWTHVVTRFRHVYQRANDGLSPAFVERAAVEEDSHAV